jgi:hypothetical protein
LRAACARDRSPGSVGAAPWLARLAPVVIAGAAGAIFALSGLAWNARVAARVAALSSDEARGAAALSAHAVVLAPWDPDARMLRAELLLREGAHGAEALEEAEAVVRLTPVRAAAHALRGRARLALGDLPGGFGDLREAARLNPLREEYARDRDALAARLPAASRRVID